MENSVKTWKEKMLELMGFKIWPPTHGDPRIKGPQPRIVTRKAYERLMKSLDEADGQEAAGCGRRGGH